MICNLHTKSTTMIIINLSCVYLFNEQKQFGKPQPGTLKETKTTLK